MHITLQQITVSTRKNFLIFPYNSFMFLYTVVVLGFSIHYIINSTLLFNHTKYFLDIYSFISLELGIRKNWKYHCWIFTWLAF